MEKKWFCYFRLVLLACLVFSSTSLVADQVKQSEVEVEVDVIEGDKARTLEVAKQTAFRQAVAGSLDASISEEERAVRLRRASNFVKSFRLLSQKEEGGKLTAKYLVEVVVASAEPVMRDDGGFRGLGADAYMIEFSWEPTKTKLSAADIRKSLRDNFSAQIGLMSLQYGNLSVELVTSAAPSQVVSRLSSEYRSRAAVRLVEKGPIVPETNQGFETDDFFQVQ